MPASELQWWCTIGMYYPNTVCGEHLFWEVLLLIRFFFKWVCSGVFSINTLKFLYSSGKTGLLSRGCWTVHCISFFRLKMSCADHIFLNCYIKHTVVLHDSESCANVQLDDDHTNWHVLSELCCGEVTLMSLAVVLCFSQYSKYWGFTTASYKHFSIFSYFIVLLYCSAASTVISASER